MLKRVLNEVVGIGHKAGELRRSLAGVGVVHSLGMPTMLISSVVLARSLSVEQFGQYGHMIAQVSVLALPVTAGLPMYVSRESAKLKHVGDWQALLGMMRAAYTWAALATIFVCAGCYWIWLGQGRALTAVDLVTALLVPLTAFTAIQGAALKGVGRAVSSAAFPSLVFPLMCLIGYLALWLLGLSGLSMVAAWYCVSSLLLLLMMTFALRGVTRAHKRAGSQQMPIRVLVIAALPMALMTAVTSFFANSGALALGWLGRDSDVAYLAVSQRGAQIVAMPMLIANTVLISRLAGPLLDGDSEAARGIIRKTSRICFSASTFSALLFFAVGRDLLSYIYGEAYGGGAYYPLLALVCSQWISTLLGFGPLMLIVAGYEVINLQGQALGVIVAALVGYWLLPGGAMAVAMALAIGGCASQGFMYIRACQKCGIKPGVI